MEKADLASSYFRQGYACSQSVLLAFAEEYGLTPALAARIASGFGAGMGRTGRTCGAVSGALMVLGLEFGASGVPDACDKDNAYARARQFLDAFQQQHGTLDCNALLCVDIGTSEGLSEARAQGKFVELCPVLVGDAVRTAAQILSETNKTNT
jgi:C_GCAxxG_C_C family probable redox protein